jgi:hypothetical protein
LAASCRKPKRRCQAYQQKGWSLLLQHSAVLGILPIRDGHHHWLR